MQYINRKPQKVQMVVVDVQHHRQVRGELEEGLGELAGLNDDVIALAGLAVAVDQGFPLS